MTNSIENILARAGSALCHELADAMQAARERAALTKRIAAAYPVFEGLRDTVLERRSVRLTALHRPILAALEDFDMVEQAAGGWRVIGNDAHRYLTGGWLEEYVALAVAEVGADEVFTGQKIRWHVGDIVGENEIDVLARFGPNLFMCSCKALKSTLLPDDVRTRERLMSALHEADNLADHFAPSGGIVALAVTTDLVDERTRLLRYQQLHGKAAVLGVNMLTLEHMPWPTLLKRLTAMLVADKADVHGVRDDQKRAIS